MPRWPEAVAADTCWSADERALMQRALDLAALGRYSTRPNPMVGCVLVRDGEIIGSGWHQRAGQPHAEVHALRQAGERARGATAYVTLEPCAHHGRTPPCAEALLAVGISELIAAHPDPDPRVAGAGLARLQQAGVRVRCGLLAGPARWLNRGFLSRIERQRPWLRLKLALSLDGAMALADGRSQWITGPAARADGQAWRARSGAILSGIGSVLADDPRLDVRFEHDPAPAPTLPVLLDSQARLPASARLLGLHPHVLWAQLQDRAAAATQRDPLQPPTAGPMTPPSATRSDAAESNAAESNASGASAGCQLEVLPCPAAADGRIDLHWLLHTLAQRQINEVHAEAGPTLAAALLRADLVDELLIYQAGKLLGDGSLRPFDLPAAGAVPEAAWRLLDARALQGDLRSRWVRTASEASAWG